MRGSSSPTSRRRLKLRNEAGARRARRGAKASRSAEGDEDGVDNDESARGVEGKSLPKTPFVLRTHQALWLSHEITG